MKHPLLLNHVNLGNENNIVKIFTPRSYKQHVLFTVFIIIIFFFLITSKNEENIAQVLKKITFEKSSVELF